MEIGELTLPHFLRAVGDRFDVAGAAARPGQTLDLVEACPLPTGPQDTTAEGRSFSAIFRGTAAALPQGIHRLTHPRLGTLDLFLVPLGPDAGGMLYEAVFNREV